MTKSLALAAPAADEILTVRTPLDERLDDPAWVDAEFAAIITANWDDEPPGPPSRPTGLPARWHRPVGARQSAAREQLASPTVVDNQHHRRQRSPPN